MVWSDYWSAQDGIFSRKIMFVVSEPSSLKRANFLVSEGTMRKKKIQIRADITNHPLCNKPDCFFD